MTFESRYATSFFYSLCEGGRGKGTDEEEVGVGRERHVGALQQAKLLRWLWAVTTTQDNGMLLYTHVRSKLVAR
jgi:hypothetical protein